METLHTTDLTKAECWLFITILLYFLMNGAQIFETLVLVPKWTAAPPQSFALLADKNGWSLKTFWIVFHSVHEVAFILAIVFCWNISPVRNGLLIVFFLHFAVRIWTLAYFAPQIIEFQRIAETAETGKNLLEKTSLWKTLNYLRVALFLALSIGLIPLCIKLMNMRYKI